MEREIHAVLSSPYRRAVDTVRPFAEARGMEIERIEAFRERRVDSVWIDDFNAFARRQWADFSYKLADGECLREVQVRNIAGVMRVLREYEGKRVVIGGHGTSISTVLNHFDPTFGYEGFESIRRLMPWIVRLDFDGETFLGMEKFNIME
jgi:2,3-bisphosphoglycerate-dependent phosphoglycerate mutase